MPETAKAAPKSKKTATTTATATATPEFELPKSVREFAERGLDQTREAYGQFKTAAEEAAGLIEETTSKAADTATDMNLKAIDFAKSNVDATFELTRKLLKTRDINEAIELQVEFARKQVEAYNAQAKDMTTFATKAVQDATEPFKTQATKSWDQFRSVFPN